jgi:DNA-binding transcriptional regulator GbsR (MarR family)
MDTQEFLLKNEDILTLREVAQILRCSKTHVSNVLNGKVAGVPRLTHVPLGRRKIIRRSWLDQWLEETRARC